MDYINGDVKLLKEKFSDIPIGYSTHENPSDFDGIKIAVSKGAEVFEKHVGLSSDEYKLNKYSVDIQECEKWLISLKQTIESTKIIKKNSKEIESLNSLKRGIFVKKNW